jgi:hypothetical protein
LLGDDVLEIEADEADRFEELRVDGVRFAPALEGGNTAAKVCCRGGRGVASDTSSSPGSIKLSIAQCKSLDDGEEYRDAVGLVMAGVSVRRFEAA